MSPDGVRIVHYWGHTYLIEQFGLSRVSGVEDNDWILSQFGQTTYMVFQDGLTQRYDGGCRNTPYKAYLGLSNNGVYAAILNPIFGWIGKLTERGGHRPEYPLQNDAHEMGLSGHWS